MSCSDCNFGNEAKFCCSCSGLLICEQCLHKHVGQGHLVHDLNLLNSREWMKADISELNKLQKCKSNLSEYEEKMKKRALYKVENFQKKYLKWDFKCNWENIEKCLGENIQYSPPRFTDFDRLEKYVPLVLSETLYMVNVDTYETSLIPWDKGSRYFFTIFFYNQCVHIAGGCDKFGSATSKVSNITAASEFHMNFPRFYHSTVVFGDSLYVIGGHGDVNSATTIEIFDLIDPQYPDLYRFAYKLKFPVSSINNNTLCIHFLSRSSQKLLTLDILDLSQEVEATDLDYGQVIVPSINKDSLYSLRASIYIWTNTLIYNLNNKKVIFVDANANKLLEYEFEEQDLKEVDMRLLRGY